MEYWKMLTQRVMKQCMCDVLVEAREEAGMTQVEVARALGQHPPHVNKTEGRDRNVLVVELPEYAGAVKLDFVEVAKRLDRCWKVAAGQLPPARGGAKGGKRP